MGDAGGKVGQLSPAYGANDMGSVMIEENVVRAAGASYCMDEVRSNRNIEDAGFRGAPQCYALRILGGPISVNVMRPDARVATGARRRRSRARELANYPAARSGKQLRIISH